MVCENSMKVVVTGGTGFIGRELCRSLAHQGMGVTVFSRNILRAKAVLDPLIKIVEWDGMTSGAWETELASAAAVINLAGAPIAEGRWTPKRKRLIIDSRVNATRLLVQAISRIAQRPRVLISASGIGFYGTSQDR